MSLKVDCKILIYLKESVLKDHLWKKDNKALIRRLLKEGEAKVSNYWTHTSHYPRISSRIYKNKEKWDVSKRFLKKKNKSIEILEPTLSQKRRRKH
jgi:hypothetical protein